VFEAHNDNFGDADEFETTIERYLPNSKDLVDVSTVEGRDPGIPDAIVEVPILARAGRRAIKASPAQMPRRPAASTRARPTASSRPTSQWVGASWRFSGVGRWEYPTMARKCQGWFSLGPRLVARPVQADA